MTDNQAYISVELSYSDNRLFLLEDGLMFLRALGRSIPHPKEGRNRPSEHEYYRVTFLTTRDLEQQQINHLLGLGDQ